MLKNKKVCIIVASLLVFVIAGIGGSVYFIKTGVPVQGKNKAQYEAVEYEYTDGYMKVSSKIIDEDYKEGAAVKVSLGDLKEIVLQSCGLSYTCEIAQSADEAQIKNGFNSICANGDEAVQEYLDSLIETGTIMFYKTGVLEQGKLEEDFITVENDEDNTTIIFSK